MNAFRRAALGGGALIALAALAAYSNSFGVPFIFDDVDAITRNRTIQAGATLAEILRGQPGTSAMGRPLLNLSLAFNEAVSGAAVWSYHAFNLLVHIGAGLVLFGLVRRTLLMKSGKRKAESGNLKPEAVSDPTLTAFFVALLWTVHPLQTESVTYVIQRAESLMGLFYLLTLYCFVRCVELEAEERRRPFPLFAFRFSLFCACLLGMATKEVMATAPLMVLMYDRTFVGGSFRAAGRRWRFHAALMSTWLVLLFLLAQTGGNRGGTIGYAVSIPWWKYALTQFQAVTHYLQLSLWPHPLVLDYGAAWVRGPADVLPYVPVVAAVVAGTAYALWRHPRAGFLGFWFLAILAPTSSIIPGIRQTLAEHRMYLPLAAVLVALVLAVQRLAGRWLGPRRGPACSVGLCCLASGAAAAGTWARNTDYRSALSIWADTAAKRPGNEYAHYNLGFALADAGRQAEAVAEDQEAVRLNPGLAEGHDSLALALAASGRLREAIAEYARALELEPGNASFEFNLANALAQAGNPAAALGHFERALRLQPDFPAACLNLGNALLELGRPDDAIRQYREALRLQPDYPDAQNNLTVALRAQPAGGPPP